MITHKELAIYQLGDLIARLNREKKGRYSFGAVWKYFEVGGPLNAYAIHTRRGLAFTPEDAEHAVKLITTRRNVGKGRGGWYDSDLLYINAPYGLTFNTIHWVAKTCGQSTSSIRRIIYKPTDDERGLLKGLYFEWPGGLSLTEDQYNECFAYIVNAGYGPRPNKPIAPVRKRRKPLVIGSDPQPKG